MEIADPLLYVCGMKIPTNKAFKEERRFIISSLSNDLAPNAWKNNRVGMIQYANR